MILSEKALSATTKAAPKISATDGGDPTFRFVSQAKGFEKNRRAGREAFRAFQARTEQDYQQNFTPINKSLRDLALSQYDDAATRSEAGRAGTLFDVGMGAMSRERAGMGLGELSAGQQSRVGLRRKLAEIDAGNRKIGFDQSSREYAQNQMIDAYGDSMAGARSVYGDISERELDRKAQYQAARSAHQSSLVNMGMSVVGSAMAFM